jgi:hypothetical protein
MDGSALGSLQLLWVFLGLERPRKFFVLFFPASDAAVDLTFLRARLLTSLSQRQESGILTGELLVDGKPLDAGFQKSTGLCLQSDVHLPSSTVREVRGLTILPLVFIE